MRYIRTNYEIYDTEDLYICDELNGKPYATNNGAWLIYKESIVKEADTIEELCDERVIIDALGNHIIVKTEIEEIWWKQHDEECVKCYGAIWTNKGLVYVAKMNEKGKLELL